VQDQARYSGPPAGGLPRTAHCLHRSATTVKHLCDDTALSALTLARHVHPPLEQHA